MALFQRKAARKAIAWCTLLVKTIQLQPAESCTLLQDTKAGVRSKKMQNKRLDRFATLLIGIRRCSNHDNKVSGNLKHMYPKKIKSKQTRFDFHSRRGRWQKPEAMNPKHDILHSRRLNLKNLNMECISACSDFISMR